MANETILIVDDSPEMVQFLQGILIPQGYRLASTGDGKSTLEIAVSRNPDLITLDMSMPRAAGMKMRRTLRKTACKAPVNFMTMHVSESIVVQALRLGVRDCINKPFEIEEAPRAVDDALRDTRMTREKEELARNVVAAETVRRTVVTLVQEVLEKEQASDPMLSRIVQDSATRMIDIEAVPKEEMVARQKKKN